MKNFLRDNLLDAALSNAVFCIKAYLH